MSAMLDAIRPLREFVHGMTRVVESEREEAGVLERAKPLLARLIASEGWLPEEFTRPDAGSYRQYLLHCDPLERFSVVSFVWGPGQRTPIHDHTVWGLIGMLRGAEQCIHYEGDGRGGARATGEEHLLRPGEIDAVSPAIGDIHVVANALADRPSISIHAYGANIGAVRRHVFDAASGAPREFISGYSAAVVPNLWDRSGRA